MNFDYRNIRYFIKKVDSVNFGIIVEYKGTDFHRCIEMGSLAFVKGKFMYILQNKQALYRWVIEQMTSAPVAS